MAPCGSGAVRGGVRATVRAPRSGWPRAAAGGTSPAWAAGPACGAEAVAEPYPGAARPAAPGPPAQPPVYGPVDVRQDEEQTWPAVSVPVPVRGVAPGGAAFGRLPAARWLRRRAGCARARHGEGGWTPDVPSSSRSARTTDSPRPATAAVAPSTKLVAPRLSSAWRTEIIVQDLRVSHFRGATTLPPVTGRQCGHRTCPAHVRRPISPPAGRTAQIIDRNCPFASGG